MFEILARKASLASPSGRDALTSCETWSLRETVEADDFDRVRPNHLKIESMSSVAIKASKRAETAVPKRITRGAVNAEAGSNANPLATHPPIMLTTALAAGRPAM